MSKKNNKIPILKFQLTKFEKGLAFQVIEQNKLFLNTDPKTKITFESHETSLKIITSHLPKFDLDSSELYLRGSQEANHFDIPTTTFVSNEARDVWFEFILNAIKVWARSCANFQEFNGAKIPELKRSGHFFEI